MYVMYVMYLYIICLIKFKDNGWFGLETMIMIMIVIVIVIVMVLPSVLLL
jgi:hypothetical protein